MYKVFIPGKPIVLIVYFALSYAFSIAQTSPAGSIDLQKARMTIENLDKQFAKHFYNGDSVAIYKMYAKDAEFESLKGNDILLAWGNQIRNGIKNDTRNLAFTTTSLSTDSEFLVETGIYEFKDSNGNLKYKGKYLVVWKQEDGTWKLYRDLGL